MSNLTLDRPVVSRTTPVRRPVAVPAALGTYTGTASGVGSYTGTTSITGAYTGRTARVGSYVLSER